MRKIIGELQKQVNGEERDVYLALELAEKLYGRYIDGITDAFEAAVASPNTTRRYAQVMIYILEEYLDTNQSVSFEISDVNTNDIELNNLILDSVKSFNQKNYKLACYSIWGALERIKTYYYEEDVKYDKSKLSNKLLNTISKDNERLRNFYEDELSYLTKIGNTFGIRHKEKNQFILDVDEYYKYLYVRCALFMKLCIINLNGEESNEI